MSSLDSGFREPRIYIPLEWKLDDQEFGRSGYGCGLFGHMCACAHAHVLMCMLGCLSNVVLGFFSEKTFLFAVVRTRDSSLPLFPPAPSPWPDASRLREEHYLDRGLWHFSAESCWQGFGEEFCS